MTRLGFNFAFLTLGILLFFIAGTRAQETDDETEFSYHEGPRGPENWGNLTEKWRLCGIGKLQSPINVTNTHAQPEPSFKMVRHYSPANATLVNRGHDIMLNWSTGGGTIQIDGKHYKLKQGHWHHPAEHVVEGIRHPLEMHMVHQSDDGAIAVVGILYKFGEPEPFLAKLRKHLQSLKNMTPPEENVGKVDPMKIDVSSFIYFRYLGSLTTPPCSEGVIWTIVENVKTVSREQVTLLQNVVHDDFHMNARPLQPLNGRIVKKFYVVPLITGFTADVAVD